MNIGILGGGQLAKMLTLAAIPMGIKTICLDPNPDACAGQITTHIIADYDDQQALADLCQQVDVITFENENIDLEVVDYLSEQLPVWPTRKALQVSQDRLLEKNFFHQHNIATVAFSAIDSLQDLEHAGNTLSYPLLLKTRRWGYDGKGQMLIKNKDDNLKAWEHYANTPLIAEAFVDFRRELSLITVRNQQGEQLFYPLTENQHKDGILRVSQAPFIDEHLQQQAQQIAQLLGDAFSYVGILSIEFFQIGDRLLVNEIAPRVHNSGHWTIEGAHCSQFENHLRAICDLPLGPTDANAYSVMFNCIGEMPDCQTILQKIPTAHIHDYGKQARPQRKLGHITITAANKELITPYLQADFTF